MFENDDEVDWIALQGNFLDKNLTTLPALGKEWNVTFDLTPSELPRWVHLVFFSFTS